MLLAGISWALALLGPPLLAVACVIRWLTRILLTRQGFRNEHKAAVVLASPETAD
jgi:hypothetical protein